MTSFKVFKGCIKYIYFRSNVVLGGNITEEYSNPSTGKQNRSKLTFLAAFDRKWNRAGGNIGRCGGCH